MPAPANGELDALAREFDTFAYTIAHDLRAPLRAMQGFSRILLDEHGNRLDPQGRRLAERINAAAVRMDVLIQQLLTYSRLSRDEVQLVPVHLGDVLDGVLSSMRPTLDARGATVEVDRPLPLVRGHADLLSTTLRNLLCNATKFVPAGERPRVRVRAFHAAGAVRVDVADEGIGIDPDLQHRMFQAFQRLHDGQYPGSGLGLATVRRAVERMGGRVGFESAPSRGSTFWFELSPAQDGPAPEAQG